MGRKNAAHHTAAMKGEMIHAYTDHRRTAQPRQRGAAADGPACDRLPSGGTVFRQPADHRRRHRPPAGFRAPDPGHTARLSDGFFIAAGREKHRHDCMSPHPGAAAGRTLYHR